MKRFCTWNFPQCMSRVHNRYACSCVSPPKPDPLERRVGRLEKLIAALDKPKETP